MKLIHISRSLLKRNADQILSETKTLPICHRSFATRATHYDVLRLKKNCTSCDIRNQFQKLSKMYHPDTSKTGSPEHNSRKFQEIMEAYRVLSKKSSREAYDVEISVADYPNPYYATPFKQNDRRHYDAHSAYWQQMHNMRNHSTGYYRTNQHNNSNENWNPVNFIDKKRIYTFLLIFMLVNYLAVYITYRLTKRNQIMGYTGHGHTVIYGMPRYRAHGISAQNFQRNDPKNE